MTMVNDDFGNVYDDGVTTDDFGNVYVSGQPIDFGTNPLEQPNYGVDPTSNVEVLTPEERAAAVAAGMPTDTKEANSWLSGIKNSSIGKALGKHVTKQDGSTNWGALLAGGSALATMSGLNKPNRPPTGYQGGIPEYTASRAQLPIPNDPNRRPGQGGIRYMSDLQYLPKSAASATTPVAPAVSPVAEKLPLEQPLAAGGIASGKYLRGNTDGMADKIPASIGEHQPAKLSHGEFVIPADVVSHIGNGNSDAGAERLYSMMDKIRQARTGTKKQGKQINPDKFMPDKGYAAGGIVGFADGGTTTLPAGTTGVESKLTGKLILARKLLRMT